jgi:hypothetical protein
MESSTLFVGCGAGVVTVGSGELNLSSNALKGVRIEPPQKLLWGTSRHGSGLGQPGLPAWPRGCGWDDKLAKVLAMRSAIG